MSYYESNRYPYIQENFLSLEICNGVIEYVSNNLHKFEENISQNVHFWSKRVIDFDKIESSYVRKIMIDKNVDIGNIIQKICGKKVYPDTYQIIRWFKGYELLPHADKENPDGAEHPFPWRHFASLVYLNDDYEGGQIYFPNKGIELKPKPGTLVIFPGTSEFLHGVREVPEGVRYTLPTFFTLDSTKGRYL